MAVSASRSSVLDGAPARIAAVVVALAAAGALAYLHRDDIRGAASVAAGEAPQGATGKANDPFAKCMAEHGAKIDAMVKEGVVKPDLAATFKGRAEGLCRAQASGATKAR
ncbi:MAG: hypothetical protein ACT4N4_02570 [Rhodospirillales bacterium]